MWKYGRLKSVHSNVDEKVQLFQILFVTFQQVAEEISTGTPSTNEDFSICSKQYNGSVVSV